MVEVPPIAGAALLGLDRAGAAAAAERRLRAAFARPPALVTSRAGGPLTPGAAHVTRDPLRPRAGREGVAGDGGGRDHVEGVHAGAPGRAGAIGMQTAWSASCSHREDRPSPSVPSSSATRRRAAPGPERGTDRRRGLVRGQGEQPETRPRATPPARRTSRSSARSGMANTAPMDTLTARRYSGSAQRGDRITASMPNAAAHRKIAPTLP